MRILALLGCTVLLAACTKADAPPAADTSAGMAAEMPATASLASMAGLWDTNVRRQGTDSVVTTNVLNTTDSTAWSFAFPNRESIPMRITGMSGDTVLWETGSFESSVRKGIMTRNTGKTWLRDGKLRGLITARYDGTGPDSVIVFETEGTKR